ncbi:PREDICTED: protein EVI2B [Charadrius vociferus]|uniref:protein EVI2B n=1 Tax=Charadrius vociferus TaxID=50402 RepID=UPI000521447A|nr:PREDICTED: protein EVI2B [Charadrius vociferus]
MANNQLILVLFYGELWKSLSTAIPQNVSTNKRNAYTGIRSPRADKAPPYPLQATGLRPHKSGRALTVTTPPQFPKAYAEPSDGSWIAALLIGIILISMIMAIIIILLWKCCKRPVLVDSNWAGRSPFADGDTPDVFMDSDQATKRSSVLFMLPWKWKQDTNSQQDPAASEKPSRCSSSNENSQAAPPAADCSVAGVANMDPPPPPPISNTDGFPALPIANTDGSPAPPDEAASPARDSCPHPTASPDFPDLPPPPDWLREPAEDNSSDHSKSQGFPSETEEQLPPPPESLIQEIHAPLPQQPQPGDPL